MGGSEGLTGTNNLYDHKSVGESEAEQRLSYWKFNAGSRLEKGDGCMGHDIVYYFFLPEESGR